MSTDALDRAYDLIKAGDNNAAIEILEPIIRSDRDNEDAWWLLANATSDPEARRNALNNVLRLSDNEPRREKAENLLAQLDNDPYEFDAPDMSYGKQYDSYPTPRQAASGGGWSCGRVAIAILGVMGLCACVACFGLFAAGQAIGETFTTIPDNTEDLGMLVEGEAITDSVTDERWDRFTFDGERGERVIVTVSNDAVDDLAPLIFLYDPNDELIFDAVLETVFDLEPGNTVLDYELAESGEYTVVVSLLTGMESSDYTIEFERR